MKKDIILKEFKDSSLDGHIDIDYILNKEFDNEDDLKEEILEHIRQQDIIYYATAMEYLRENDPSLRDSLSLASDICCELESLNSETLATILFHNKSEAALYDLDLSDAFDD
jgi:hypothetical protein